MRSIRRVMLAGPGRVVVESVRSPAPSPDDCVVRVSVAAVCSTDAKAFLGGPTRLELGSPPVLGHEVCGYILQPGRHGLPAGTKVAVIGTWFCESCVQCLRGRYLRCLHFRVAAAGFADELVIPDKWCAWRLVPLESSTSPVVGAYLDSIACVYRAVRLARPQENERVLVCGGGFMAVLAARLVTATSGTRAAVVTDSPAGRATLNALGISNYTWSETLGSQNADLSADVIIDLGGREELGELCSKKLNHGGRCVLMNGGSRAVLPAAGTIYQKRIDIYHSFHNDLSDREAAREHLETLAETVDALSRGFPCEDAAAALSMIAERRHPRCHLIFN